MYAICLAVQPYIKEYETRRTVAENARTLGGMTRNLHSTLSAQVTASGRQEGELRHLMTHDTTLRTDGFSTQSRVSGATREAATAPANGNGRPRMTNQLRILRADQSWSQTELARQLGVSRQTVNALERGKYHPSLPLAFRISYLFERPIEDVFHPQWKRGGNGD